MVVAIAIEMNRPCEIGARAELLDLLLEQQRIGAEVDEFLACDQTRDDLIDVAVEQRLATGEHDDWGPTFIDGIKTLVDAQALIEDRVGVIDLATACTSEVAAKQRFQHQDQRIPPYTLQVLSDDIGAYADRLAQRDGHEAPSSEVIERHSSAGDIGQLRRHPEADIFGNAWKHRQLDIGQFAQPRD